MNLLVSTVLISFSLILFSCASIDFSTTQELSSFEQIKIAVEDGRLHLTENDLVVLEQAKVMPTVEELQARLELSSDARCCCEFSSGGECMPNVLVETCTASGYRCKED